MFVCKCEYSRLCNIRFACTTLKFCCARNKLHQQQTETLSFAQNCPNIHTNTHISAIDWRFCGWINITHPCAERAVGPTPTNRTEFIFVRYVLKIIATSNNNIYFWVKQYNFHFSNIMQKPVVQLWLLHFRKYNIAIKIATLNAY